MEHVLDEKVSALLDEFALHRDEIKKMIEEVDDLRQDIDLLIPKKLDVRYVRFFEEKVKSMTGFFSTLLDMRKEIIKSIKDEIELRRKLGAGDASIDVEGAIDIRSIADKIETFKKSADGLKAKRLKRAKDETDQIVKSVDVTKLHEAKSN
ncbi:MAG: hypothetical protein ACTSVO_13535 [Candidatus Heimdallarchaeaceae archaeon]